MRAVLDPNVIISALISSKGAPAAALSAWQDGAFELVVSPMLLAELRRALAYPKLQRRIDPTDADVLLDWIAASAVRVEDPAGHSLKVHSRDPGDDYLLALAAEANALLASGDDDLLDLGQELPMHTPRSFVALVRT